MTDDDRKPLPKRIYVERWPDGDDDQIHYQPTGYGVRWSPTGERIASVITVYERVPQRVLAAERRAKKDPTP